MSIYVAYIDHKVKLKFSSHSLIPSVLTYIFMIDVSLPYTQPTSSPRIADFTERILLQLKPLTEGDEEIQNHVVEENEVGEQDERTQAIKLLKTGTTSMQNRRENLHTSPRANVRLWEMKTLARLSAVLKWLIASAGRSFSTAVAEQLRLLPLLFKVKHSLAHSFIHSIHRPPAPLSFHLSLHPRAEISELRCPS